MKNKKYYILFVSLAVFITSFSQEKKKTIFENLNLDAPKLTKVKASYKNNSKKALKELLKITRYHIKISEDNYYIKWIKNNNYKTITKSDHLGQSFTCYERKYNFRLLSYSDPLTEDEINFILSFYNDINNTKTSNIREIPLDNITQIFLNNNKRPLVRLEIIY